MRQIQTIMLTKEAIMHLQMLAVKMSECHISLSHAPSNRMKMDRCPLELKLVIITRAL